MTEQVAAFTDTYLPTVNGVTYTIKSWRDRWNREDGWMDVVYPDSEGHSPDAGEYPVRSVPFPFYEGFRVGAPQIPDAVENADVIHAHTAFALGLASLRLARAEDKPLVASYHTPTAEYAEYISPSQTLAGGLQKLSKRYERWFYDRADLVITPSEPTRRHLTDVVGVDTPVRVVSNGIDIEQFRPVDPTDFRDRYDLSGTLVGYTGRHGYEKELDQILAAAEGLDATVVFGGDGPARSDLEREARRRDVDARFLGFLDREEMPAFYSALDVFTFPSPVETQGLVALEANACGTPVVGVNDGALAETVDDGVTGYHFERGDVTGFREGIQQALADHERLSENCLARRDRVSIDNAVDRLASLYDNVS
ncbi:glycosyltransferase [Haloarchaeobius amylolyticus]|uniref:glycosyltransferase n=1 Tax=Haloarchaeobius amylolyticus TaxID=1198296 RepID=UPI00226DFC3E|nr:glycosyltransferase [Haloarchaeobius amylolyticus]